MPSTVNQQPPTNMPRFVIITWINNQLFFLKEFPSDGPIVTTRNPAQARVFEMLNVCQLTHAWLAQNHPAVWHWALYDAVERRTTKDDRPLTTINHQQTTIL